MGVVAKNRLEKNHALVSSPSGRLIAFDAWNTGVLRHVGGGSGLDEPGSLTQPRGDGIKDTSPHSTIHHGFCKKRDISN